MKLFEKFMALPYTLQLVIRLALELLPFVHIIVYYNPPEWVVTLILVIGFPITEFISMYFFPLYLIEHPVTCIWSLVIFFRHGYCGMPPVLYWISIGLWAFSIFYFIGILVKNVWEERRR